MLGSLVVLVLASLSIASPTLEKRAITCLKVGQTATASWTNSAGKKCTFTGVVGSNYGANPSGSGECGAGCSGTAVGNVYTQDCFSHDICSYFNAASGGASDPNCGAAYNAAVDDTALGFANGCSQTNPSNSVAKPNSAPDGNCVTLKLETTDDDISMLTWSVIDLIQKNDTPATEDGTKVVEVILGGTSLRKPCSFNMSSTQSDAQIQAQDSGTSRRAEWAAISKHQAELSDIWGKLEHHPSYNGVFSLGKDGILRSLGPDRDVHDAVPLSPHLIKALLDRLPFRPENEIDFRGVDGRNTPKEQWYYPDKGLLPPPLVQTEEQRKLIESKRDETRRILEEAKKRPRCPPQIMSDHDLGLRETASGDVS
ncbi:hypothetical protein FDENT_618 [Fusarium denticulatum]|uniref:DUF8213 domain-containing protein n=1 Tax=Fusarium denticulatum TaxID=48507 RepID=A0A8H5XJN7_9HYPO|nr:hypothetical protein FDENT_618 [Fusarium denticulatum]